MPNRPLARAALTLLALVLALPLAPRAHAGGVADWDGHLTLGYAMLARSGGAGDAEWPSGSLSVRLGVDRAFAPGWRAGVSLGYHLLGSTTIERGSFASGVDYTAVDAALLVSRDLPGPYGLFRLAAGPALMGCSATLSTSGGGAGFSDLAVDEVAPGVGFDLLWTSSRPRPVRVGLEAGLRSGFVPDDTWTVVHTGLAILY